MNDIKWEDGAVCYAGISQWNHLVDNLSIINSNGFQLNEIRQGDYIEASELDTEQKYNDAVEEFGLFGFKVINNIVNENNYSKSKFSVMLTSNLNMLLHVLPEHPDLKRKITYSQLMAIGKLKRAIIEKSAPKIAPDLTPYVEINSDWSDEHYNHFHQLTEEDIKAGQIKVDAYFVNRMWKINSWEDTGAGFHILKTLPRIANNKNSLKRELVALKKQVDILCKLHGVDDDTN